MDKKEETRRFESEMLALPPPLKMYLLNVGEQRAEKAAQKPVAAKKPRKRIEEIAAVVRLIDRLSEEE